MTPAEKAAVKCLEIESVPDEQPVSKFSLSMEERAANRHKENHCNDIKYLPCDFIVGSSAEVERLFSAKNVMTRNRSRMTPEVFEAIVLLKFNERCKGRG